MVLLLFLLRFASILSFSNDNILYFVVVISNHWFLYFFHVIFSIKYEINSKGKSIKLWCLKKRLKKKFNVFMYPPFICSSIHWMHHKDVAIKVSKNDYSYVANCWKIAWLLFTSFLCGFKRGRGGGPLRWQIIIVYVGNWFNLLICQLIFEQLCTIDAVYLFQFADKWNNKMARRIPEKLFVHFFFFFFFFTTNPFK